MQNSKLISLFSFCTKEICRYLSKWTSNWTQRICCSSFWSSSIVSCKSIRPAIMQNHQRVCLVRGKSFSMKIFLTDECFSAVRLHTHTRTQKKGNTFEMLSIRSQGTWWERCMTNVKMFNVHQLIWIDLREM